jgi:hypothetical protein
MINKNETEKKKFHKSKEELCLEAEINFNKKYLFKPKIINKNKDNNEIVNPNIRINQMQELYKKSCEDREKQKKDFLKIELMSCTFQPKITKKGDVSLNINKRSTSPKFNAVEYLSGGSGYDMKGEV